MRPSSKANSTLAVVAVSAFFGACEPRAEAVEEPAQVVSPGSELMAQQAPQVQRPTFTGVRGPRMDPSEVSGRWPFYWTRAIYSGYRRGRGGYGSWAIDFPKGDRQFLFVLKRLVRLDAYDWEKEVSQGTTSWHDLNREAQAEVFKDVWAQGQLIADSVLSGRGNGVFYDATGAGKVSLMVPPASGIDRTAICDEAVSIVRSAHNWRPSAWFS